MKRAMKNLSKRDLKLDRITVRILTAADLERVVGGEGPQTLGMGVCCTKGDSMRQKE
jgi:hypothetical protein